MAAAPQLFELCWNLKSILGDNLIVTKEGFQIDCSEIKKALLDTTLRQLAVERLQRSHNLFFYRIFSLSLP